MIFSITSADASLFAGTVGLVTPLVGSFLLVIRWIVNFQKDITDKYREELKETRKEFDQYKLETETKLIAMNSRIDSLLSLVEDTEIYSTRLVNFIKDKGLDLPSELERRKVTAK
jgi:hypothetical protein